MDEIIKKLQELVVDYSRDTPQETLIQAIAFLAAAFQEVENGKEHFGHALGLMGESSRFVDQTALTLADSVVDILQQGGTLKPPPSRSELN